MQAMRGSQKSLILVARQLGVHIGPNDIPEQFKIDERELSPKEMCELAKSFDLKAKATKINEDELIKLIGKKQQIIRLKNGRYIIALRTISSENEDKSILCLDTGVSNPKPQQISLKELNKGWQGEVILLKPKLKMFEETSELKLGWLFGETSNASINPPHRPHTHVNADVISTSTISSMTFIENALFSNNSLNILPILISVQPIVPSTSSQFIKLLTS